MICQGTKGETAEMNEGELIVGISHVRKEAQNWGGDYRPAFQRRSFS